MTPADFRKLALALPEAEERTHMNHPDFRVGGKIFATLAIPTRTTAWSTFRRKSSTISRRQSPMCLCR